MALYDTIGRRYEQVRGEDPLIAAQILEALGASSSVVNVGAGTGAYEPRDRGVVAVEPSEVMIRQRPAAAAPVVRGCGTSLPFADGSFDAALAVLTIHHWSDLERGLAELRRVARERVVILTWDPSARGFWLNDYLPEIFEADRAMSPPLVELETHLGEVEIVDVPIPHDCPDGFIGAYWRRPEAFLRPEVRAAISTFSKVPDVGQGLARLEQDLASGEWQRRYSDVMAHSTLDAGYRLVVATLAGQDGSSGPAPKVQRVAAAEAVVVDSEIRELEGRVASKRKASRRHTVWALLGVSPGALLPFGALLGESALGAAVILGVLVTATEAWRALRARAEAAKLEMALNRLRLPPGPSEEG